MKDEKPKAKKSKNTCRMDSLDSHGHSNLCCCYVMEKDGSYTDPCNIPAKECC